jgi:hypothetical protein
MFGLPLIAFSTAAQPTKTRKSTIRKSSKSDLNNRLSLINKIHEGFFNDSFSQTATKAFQSKRDHQRIVFDSENQETYLTTIDEKEKSKPEIFEENRITIQHYQTHLLMEIGADKLEKIQQEYQIDFDSMIAHGAPLLPEHVHKINIGINHLEFDEFISFKKRVAQFIKKHKQQLLKNPNQTIYHYLDYQINPSKNLFLSARELRNIFRLMQNENKELTHQNFIAFLENFSPDLEKIAEEEFAKWMLIAKTPQQDLEKSYTGNKIQGPIVGSYSGSGLMTSRYRPWVEDQEIQQIGEIIQTLGEKNGQHLSPEEKQKIQRTYFEYLVKVIVKKHLMRENNSKGQISTWNLGTIIPSPFKDSFGKTIYYIVSEGVDSGYGKMWYTLKPVSADKSSSEAPPIIRIYRDTSPCVYYQSGGPTISRSIARGTSAGKRYSDTTEQEDKNFFAKFSLPPSLAILYAGKNDFKKHPKKFADKYLWQAYSQLINQLTLDESYAQSLLQNIEQGIDVEILENIKRLINDGSSKENILRQLDQTMIAQNLNKQQLHLVIQYHLMKHKNSHKKPSEIFGQLLIDEIHTRNDEIDSKKGTELTEYIMDCIDFLKFAVSEEDFTHFEKFFYFDKQPRPLQILGNSLGGFDAQYDVVVQLAKQNRIPIVPVNLYGHSSIRVETSDNFDFCKYLKKNETAFSLLYPSGQKAFKFDYITQKGDIASELGSHHTFLGFSDEQDIQQFVDFKLRVFQPYDKAYCKKHKESKQSTNKEVNLGLHFNRVEQATDQDVQWLQYESVDDYNKEANNSLEKVRVIFSKVFDWIIQKTWGLSRRLHGRRGLSKKLRNFKIYVKYKFAFGTQGGVKPDAGSMSTGADQAGRIAKNHFATTPKSIKRSNSDTQLGKKHSFSNIRAKKWLSWGTRQAEKTA